MLNPLIGLIIRVLGGEKYEGTDRRAVATWVSFFALLPYEVMLPILALEGLEQFFPSSGSVFVFITVVVSILFFVLLVIWSIRHFRLMIMIPIALIGWTTLWFWQLFGESSL